MTAFDWDGKVSVMGRKIIVTSPTGQLPVLEEVQARDEVQLQEMLKAHPDLLPLEDLGLAAPALVVGIESVLDSGRIDLVLLTNGGELVLVEFKTGPQNPDFRECMAQLLDYGSDLWRMTLDDFDTRVARKYFSGSHFLRNELPPPPSLEVAAARIWGDQEVDAVDWRERLQSQLRDGSFHYVAVAQQFTRPVLRTVEYLNATMKAARFSAVEMVRFSSEGYDAFEARFVAGAGPNPTSSSGTKVSLAGIHEFVESVGNDDYRHVLQDFLEALAKIDDLMVVWGTSGCSLKVAIPGRGPLSVGWLFPPGPQRWMGLTDVTLGWYEDANGLALPPGSEKALNVYRARVEALAGGISPKAVSIRGRTFAPAAVKQHADQMVEAVRDVARALVEVAGSQQTMAVTAPIQPSDRP
jgi:hypothetical protein